MPNWEFAVGDSVTLAPGATFSQNPNLKRDQVGTISQLGDESDDEAARPALSASPQSRFGSYASTLP